MALEDKLKELQQKLAHADLLSRSSRYGDPGFTELLVLRMQDIKIKVYTKNKLIKPHIST